MIAIDENNITTRSLRYNEVEKYSKAAAYTFAVDKQEVVAFIQTSKAWRFCLIESYATFVKLGELQPFDQQDQQMKKEIIDDVEKDLQYATQREKSDAQKIYSVLYFVLKKYFT